MSMINADDDTCWNCRTVQEKFRCKGCGFALYCSQICQKEHWKSLHGSHCKYLSAKKSHPGSTHSPSTCQTCKKESVNYKLLYKSDSPGMACHIKMMDSDFKQFMSYFIVNAKFNRNQENAMKNKTQMNSVNLPFEFGEISGNYLDYLDKLLGYLQSILCHLRFRYPDKKEIVYLYQMILDIRAYHWTVSLKTSVTSERVGNTTTFIRGLFTAERIFELHEIIEKLESQHYGVTAWNTFMFLYEILGVSSLILPLLKEDIDSFDEEDIKHVRFPQVFPRTIKNKERRIIIPPLHDQVFIFREQLESLTIYDENFKLKPFQQIYEHFASPIVPETKPQENPKLNPYICEVCSKDVDPKKCQYVFHSLRTIYKTLDRGIYKHQITWEQNMLNRASEIEDKAYINFTIGSGLRVVCNEGDCKDIFISDVLDYRSDIMHSITSRIIKYEFRFTDLQCWFCKLLSGNSHRCRACKSRLYCSLECQNKDWAIHKTICKDLKESGTQLKVDAQERKESGEMRIAKHLAKVAGGCICGQEDCEKINNNFPNGKMELQDKTGEDEVD